MTDITIERTSRTKTRDHGTAAWNDAIIDAARSMPRAMAKGINDRVADAPMRPASSGVWGRMPTVSSGGKPSR